MKHRLPAEFLDESDLFGEAGITCFDAGGIFDYGSAFCQKSKNRGGHGDAMITVAIDFGSNE
jgi:hypothetical protein